MQTRLFAFTVFILSSSCERTHNRALRDYDRKVCANEPTCHLLNESYVPKSRFSLERRDCMCDKACADYRDCCSDSAYYQAEEQSQPQKFYCPPPDKVYMKINCPETGSDENLANKCLQALAPLASTDSSLSIPVTNTMNNITYGNKYCALCNGEENFTSWTDSPLCGEVKEEFLSEEGTLKSNVRLSVDYGKYRRKARQIWLNAVYDPNAGHFLSRFGDKLFVCRMQHILPRELQKNVRQCVPHLIETCSDKSNAELVEKCNSRTSIVYQIKDTRKRYRNIDCAKCNGVFESEVNGCPITLKEH